MEEAGFGDRGDVVGHWQCVVEKNSKISHHVWGLDAAVLVNLHCNIEQLTWLTDLVFWDTAELVQSAELVCRISALDST